MTVIRFNKAQDFIDALEAKRPEVQARDKDALATHKGEEKVELDRFRAECRRLAKMSYKDLKAERSKDRWGSRPGVKFDPPSCPLSEEVTLDRILDGLRVTRQQRFEVFDGGNFRGAYRILMGPAKPGGLC